VLLNLLNEEARNLGLGEIGRPENNGDMSEKEKYYLNSVTGSIFLKSRKIKCLFLRGPQENYARGDRSKSWQVKQMYKMITLASQV